MSFFSKKKLEKKNKINWETLYSISDLENAINLSEEKYVFLFKHSTRCSISSMALNRIESGWSFNELEITPYFLDLIRHRDVSAVIVEKLNVIHESPQMIIVKNKKVVLHASHSEITIKLISDLLKK